MGAFGRRMAMIRALDLRPQLRHVCQPCLVLTAPDDKVVHPSGGRELARLLPRARLLEMPVGHAALVHPRVDVARLLADRTYWPASSAADTAAASAAHPG